MIAGGSQSSMRSTIKTHNHSGFLPLTRGGVDYLCGLTMDKKRTWTNKSPSPNQNPKPTHVSSHCARGAALVSHSSSYNSSAWWRSHDDINKPPTTILCTDSNPTEFKIKFQALFSIRNPNPNHFKPFCAIYPCLFDFLSTRIAVVLVAARALSCSSLLASPLCLSLLASPLCLTLLASPSCLSLTCISSLLLLKLCSSLLASPSFDLRLSSLAVRASIIFARLFITGLVILHSFQQLYGTSLFERLMQAGYPVKMLKTQYRMHPERCAIVRKKIFSSLLK
ncbi:hypothetical protein Ahy_A02g008951 isoform B [Arachis hypogaea]|uniref:DNA2/NAM7 helicase-like C-terminal domain-containing protein n=1 Tax=Arachis hypogaea TaxID=3818 RepID=A0A445EFJ5_ARAHY|nr:hypothetical protein Ahy_A02g008951 isoform B [Arachis hypogaea]